MVPYLNDSVSDSASTFYKDGSVLCRFWLTQPDTVKHGNHVYYDQSAHVMHINHWNHGVPNGIIKEFTTEGKLISETFYTLGVKEGFHKEYHRALSQKEKALEFVTGS